MEKGKQLCDLLDHGRHRIPGLLRFVQELVDLQLLEQIGVVRLDKDRPLSTGIVENVLALDVLQLLAVAIKLVPRRRDLLFYPVDLVSKPCIIGDQVARTVGHLLDLGLHTILLLLLPVDAAREIGVLRLESADVLVHVNDLALRLLLGSLGSAHRLLNLLNLLLEHDGLLLSLLALLLSEHLGITLHGDLCLQVLRLPFQGHDLLVPAVVLGFLLLELDLV
mmetsp:Transcript_105654/g.305715  ORF Transcript_105654/g.305715 Transcript_105654/m.305715 type:complete len:222 (+) Transcript_105654:404-1069(+)